MKRCMMALSLLAVFGCMTPKPELEAVEVRDSETYVDPQGLEQKKNETKCRVSILVSPGTYKQYGDIAKILEARLTEVFSRMHAFTVVERANLSELQREQLISGGPSEVADVEADCLMTARIAAVDVSQSEGLTVVNGKRQVENKVAMTTDFRLYEKKGNAWDTLITKSSTSENVRTGLGGVSQGTLQEQMRDAAGQCVVAFGGELGGRLAPAARVVQTRGGGKVARISIGMNYGVSYGSMVEFYEYVDNSDIVAGATRDKNVVAKGRVIDVSDHAAWVEVMDYRKVRVKRGHYVAIVADQNNARRSDLSVILGRMGL